MLREIQARLMIKRIKKRFDYLKMNPGVYAKVSDTLLESLAQAKSETDKALYSALLKYWKGLI